MRPIASMPPPGVNGTTSFTMRLGQGDVMAALPCARPVRAASGASAVAAASPMKRVMRCRRLNMTPLLLGFDAGGLDDWPPEIDLGFEQPGELGRCRADD